MSEKPAFPIFITSADPSSQHPGLNAEDLAPMLGLTRRELFAAMAMQGLLNNLRYKQRAVDTPADAVTFADALIAELDKEGDDEQ